MSLLLIEIPARARLGARTDGPAEAGVRLPAEWRYVLSADGRQITRSGTAAPSLLPKADNVVAVLNEADVSWHSVTLPKVASSRWRAALAGMLEEALLDDTEQAHFALAPQAAGGSPAWVGVVHKPWLSTVLAELEGAGAVIDRVVCNAAPGGALTGHFHVADDAAPDTAPVLVLSGPQGVYTLRTSGGLARSVVNAATAELTAEPVRWTATPAAAAAAEAWTGSPVKVLTDTERLLEAGASPWNLRQFDLVSRHRGTRAARDVWRNFFSRDWRAVRYGVVALLALQLVGLNAWAWRQSQALAERKEAMNELLRSAHPQVRAVLDAPLQMQRETELLRAAAGRPGSGDLEGLMAAAAAAWPEGVEPLQALRYENNRLTLAAPGFGDAQLPPLRDRLRAAGFDAEFAEGRVTIFRAAPRRPT